MDLLSIVGDITSIVSSLHDFRKDRKESSESKQNKREEVHHNRPEFDIVDYKDYLARSRYGTKKPCDIELFVARIQSVSVRGEKKAPVIDAYYSNEHLIGVSSVYDDVHCLCRDYLSDGTETVFDVSTDQADIDYERDRSVREDLYEGHPVRHFGDGYLETLAVYRKIAEKMPEYDTILFHGSCVAVDGEGYLFTAKSGTGSCTMFSDIVLAS